VVLDVTDRKLAEARQHLLVREVDHRAKNVLAVVLAAVRLADRTDADAFATAIEGRVGAMARTHSLLAEARWTGADLCALARAELSPFTGTKLADGPELPRVEVTGPPLHIDAEAAQAFSMVLHELATNATKYGALSVPGGVVRVGLVVDDEDGKLRLQWSELNGPVIELAPAHQGFGTQVIEAIVEGQLSGSVVRHWGRQGLSCVVTVSLERVLPTSSSADKLVAVNMEQAQESAS
jgi:two-component sensor histidine kinase